MMVFLPHIILLSGILILMLLPQQPYRIGVTVLLGIVFVSVLAQKPVGTVDWVIDPLTKFTQAIVLMLSIWVIWLNHQKQRFFELLLLFSLLGALIACMAKNWLWLYLAIELIALPVYAMVLGNRSSREHSEAALKYFVMGSVSSVLILYGISMVYLSTGTLHYTMSLNEPMIWYLNMGMVLLLSGMFFKLGLVPFHFWVPDVYQVAPIKLIAWLAMVPKLVFLVVLCRWLQTALVQLEALFLLLKSIAILSMLYGALMALQQRNLRRLIAYASISHMGMIILPLAILGYKSAIFYLCAYIIISLGMFVCLSAFDALSITSVKDLLSLGYTRPALAGLFLLVLIAMTGIPPTIGFMSKLYLVMTLIKFNELSAAMAVIITTCIGGYYYMHIVRTMFFKSSLFSLDKQYTILLYGLLIIVLGLVPDLMMSGIEEVVQGSFQ